MGALFPHLAVTEDSTALTSAIIYGSFMQDLTAGGKTDNSFAIDDLSFVNIGKDLVKNESDE